MLLYTGQLKASYEYIKQHHWSVFVLMSIKIHCHLLCMTDHIPINLHLHASTVTCTCIIIILYYSVVTSGCIWQVVSRLIQKQQPVLCVDIK